MQLIAAAQFAHVHTVAVHHRAQPCVAPVRAMASHDFAVLALYTRGQATVRQRDKLELRAGDVQLLPAGEPHRQEGARAFEAWGVSFQPSSYAGSELAPLLAPFERVRAGASPIVTLTSESQQRVLQWITTLAAELRARPQAPHTSLVQRSLLALILAEVDRESAFSGAQAGHAAVVSDALTFIERHCLQNISLTDVAAAVHRSPAYVTTSLRRATGKTAVGWITTGRLAEAQRLLASTDERVDIIGERVGYADATHFIRMFRRTYGVTPAAWRAAQRPSRQARTL